MVIVIGVGKPKKEKGKGDIKKSAEEKRARARAMSFLQQMRENPKRLDEVLEKRGIDRDQFERYMKHHVGVDLKQAIKERENIPQHIDDVAKIIRGNKGQFDEQGNLKPNLLALLERRKINPNVFKRSLEINPFMDFQDRIDMLAEQAFEERKPKRPPHRSIDDIEGDRDEAPPTNDNNDTTEDDHEYPTSRFDAYPEEGSNEEEKLLEFYERLYSHTSDPMRFAMNQLRGGAGESVRPPPPTTYRFPGASSVSQMPSSFEQQHAPPGMRLGSPDEDEDPTVRFDPQSIGAETPKGATGNPRQLNDPSKDARQLGSTRTLARDFKMSSDSPNVMDEAWALLKGNPDMTDTHGNTVHPAAMKYAQYARALEDSLEHEGADRGPADMGIGVDMRDDENAARFKSIARARPNTFVGSESLDDHHKFARRRSKDDVHEYMGYQHPLGREHMHFGPDANIERMPRPEETDVANIMDEDIRRLNPKMKNIGHSSGRV